MKFFSLSRLFGSAWRGKNRSKRGAKAVSAKRVRLRLEALEDRTVMSSTNILPAPIVTNVTTIANNFPPPTGTNAFSFDPQVAVDPLNHLKMVEVHVTNNTINPTVNGSFILDGNYSTDGGQSWNALNLPGANNSDPNTGPNGTQIDSFAVAQSPSITFDRAEQVYIVSDQHDAGNTSGAIILEKFDFSNGTPTQVLLTPPVAGGLSQNDLTNASDVASGTNVLYRWQSNSSPVQDAAYNPVVAVDANVPTYTDPTTGQTQTDTMANMLAPDSSKSTVKFPKAVYVAWNTNFTEPVNSNPATRSRIMLDASADGGTDFSTVQNVSTDPVDASAPQIVFTQGTALPSNPGTVAVTGGQLTFVWSTRPTPNVFPDDAHVVGSQQDGGLKNSPVTATQDFTFAGGNVADALGASTTLTWTLASPIAVNDRTLTVSGTPGTPTDPTPPGTPFSVTIDSEVLTITQTSGDLWTIAAPGAQNAHAVMPNDVVYKSSAGNSTAVPTPFNGTVAISPTLNLTTINDLDVTINLTAPHLNQLSIVLKSPNGNSVTLLNNRTDVANNSHPPAGVADAANMGNLQPTANSTSTPDGHQAGTVFDDQAERAINDPTAAAPYVGHFRPESGSLSSLFSGTGPNGKWTITITDNLHDGSAPVQYLTDWSLHFTGVIGTIPFNNTVDTPLSLGTATLSPTNVYPLTGQAFGTSGVGPGLVLAVDNTLGGLSPYQGRLYIAYTGAGGSSVFLTSSDDGGNTWGASKKINDDSITDNFSEGNRPEFMPSLAVDQTTGTVVVTYYDARNDASLTRAANSITVSNDGGLDFSPISYLNTLKQATDFLTDKTITIEPIPGNQAQASAFGFGDRQAIAAYGGVITPIYASNQNIAGSTINTATVTTAAGPRVIYGDMGPVVADFTTAKTLGAEWNLQSGISATDSSLTVQSGSPAGPPASNSAPFTVTIDAEEMLISLVNGTIWTILQRGVNGTTPIAHASGASIIFTYNNTLAGDGTRRIDGFVVQFDRPVDIASFTASNVLAKYQDPNTGVVSDVPIATSGAILPLDAPGSSSTGFGPHSVGFGHLATTFYIKFQTPQTLVGTYSYAIGPTVQDDVRLDLTTLAAPVAANTAGNTDTITVTSDVTNAFTAGIPAAPFVIQVGGEQMLVTTATPGSTTWTVVRGYNTPTGTATPTHASGAVVSFSGNQMDQNTVGGIGGVTQVPAPNGANSTKTDSVTGASGPDMFAVPTPTNGVPFEAGYNLQTLPLIIPGPHVVSTDVPLNNSTWQLQTGIGVGDMSLTVTSIAPVPPTTPFKVMIEAEVLEISAVNGTSWTISKRGANGTQPAAHGANANIVYTPVSSDNLVLNATNGAIDVLFDRNITAGSFGKRNIVSITGPAGPVYLGGPGNPLVTVAQDASNLALFHVTFPTQTLSGTYNIVITPQDPQQAYYITDTNGYPVDTNLNAGLDLLRSGTTSAANKSRPVYGTPNPTTVVIPKSGSVSSTITVADAFQILQSAALNQSIEVELDIQMQDIRDLQATLTAPDGKTVVHLFGQSTGVFGATPFADFRNAVFDDFATNPIQNAGTPVTGTYNPQSPLSVLAGLSSQGKWTLTLTNAGPNAGTLSHWELRLPKATPGTGLGEPVADEYQASFRIFTQASINPQSSTQWTPVGPAGDTSLPANPPTGASVGAGPVGALAVDPSDPSGNTVYAGAVSGGVWKTNNFLTTSATGPTWVPLTDLGPTNSLNISSIAAYGVNNDPTKTVVFAMTGNGQFGLPGVGLLRSKDGGKTWDVLTGLTNVDANGVILPMNSSSRTREFVGSNGFKVIVDPHPYPGNQIAVYAALSGTGGGLYRSLDGGNHWILLKAGNATDVVLAPASRDNNGNETVLYAAFAGDGVYKTPIATTAPPNSLTRMDGGQIFVTRVNGPNSPIPTGNYNVNPSGANGNIVLALPAVSNNPLADLFYQGWLYAAVANTDGTFNALYLTKDGGDTWTKINLPNLGGYGTNNETRTTLDPVTNTSALTPDKQPKGNFDLTLAIDPNNPNVVYLGGSGDQVPLAADGVIRVDLTTLDDPYALSAYSNNESTGGVQFATTGPTTVPTGGAPYGILDTLDTPNDSNGTRPDPPDLSDGQPFAAYFNLYRDPIDPFVAPSTLQFSNVTQFNNSGTDAHWMQFSGALNKSTNQHAILAVTDPLTGGTRLLFGDDQGVYTGVDGGKGALVRAVGTDTVTTGDRNGNLQIAQLYTGASQPSTLAANIAGALFYASAFDNSYPHSATNVLSAGDLVWTGFAGDGDKNGTILANGRVTGAAGVAADQGGSGQLYQFIYPSTIDGPLTPFDFFQVTPGGQGFPTPRSASLIQNGDIPGLNQGQWPYYQGSKFAVNPIDPTAIIISSQTGRVFLTDGTDAQGGTGIVWRAIANPGADLDGTVASALTFGSLNTGTGAKDDFIYAGTQGGHIYVTFHPGTGQWTDISAGLAAGNSPVMQIVANPKPGSHEAYAVTTTGVYWMKDSSAAGASWVNITGGLFALTRPMFGNTSNPFATLQFLTSIQADWRYAIPDGAGTHPILYVAGNGGVFRSTDKGVTWTDFPNIASDNAAEDGGYFPNANVTALNLVLGNVDPTTAFHDPSAGLNMLVATTYGRGDFAIRLGSPINIESTSKFIEDLVEPTFGPQVIAQAPVLTNNGTILTGVTLTFAATVDPTLFNSGSVTVTGPPGPNGPLVALMPDPYAVVDQNPGTDTVFRVNFAAPQSAKGNYTITVGPNVYDMAGDQMDQDHDNGAGESTDVYSNTFLYALPVVSTVPDQIVQPGIADGPISFTVSDPNPQYPATSLTVSAMSNNQIELPNSDLTLSGTGATRFITITVPPGGVYPGSLHGPYTVTLSATDPAGYTGSSTFHVTIDNAPKLNISPNPYVINHGATTAPVNLGGADLDGDSLAYGTPTFDDPLWDLQKQLGLNTTEDTAAFGSYGAGEKWFHSTNGSNPGAGAGWYILLPNNTLLAWDGSSHATGTLVADFKTGVYSNGSLAVYYNPLLLTTTTGVPLASVPGDFPLYDLRVKYGLGGNAQAYPGYGSALWIHSSNGSNAGVGQGWFLILPDNTLVAWDGVVNHAGGSFVADLSLYSPNVFTHPLQLTNASVPTVQGVTASVSNSGQVSLTPTPGFDRAVVVDVSVTDGFLTTNGQFTFQVNDLAPTAPTPANVVDTHNQTPATINFGATHGEAGDASPLIYSVSVSGDNPLYDLQVQYGLNTPDIAGFFNAEHVNDKWFQSSNGSNAAHQGYFVLTTSNVLYAWDGTAHAGGTQVADFVNEAKYNNANVYATPGLLYAAVQPAAEVVTTQRGPLYDLREQYGLTTADIASAYNVEGAQEKWFLSTNGSNPGNGGGYFFLLPTQQLVAWDGTAHATGDVVATLTADGDVYHDTALLYQAQPAFNSAAYAVSVQFGLDSPEDTAAKGSLGVAEKWFHSSNGSNSANGGWYYLKNDNTLHAWDGGNTDTGPQVATLPASVYANTTLLTGQAFAVTAAVSNTGVVTLTPNVAFVGTVRVSASVTDGAESTTKSFLFTVTNAPPAFTTTFTNQSGSSATGMTVPPQAFTASDTDSDSLTYTAAVSSPLYSLMQAYGLNTAASGALPSYGNSKWIHSSNGSNAGAGGGWYFIAADNTLHAWDGTVNSTSKSAEVADFTNDPSYGNQNVYANPALLTSAPPLPTSVTATLTSNTVQVNWPNTFKGYIWTTVFASDGAAEVQQSFLVTVT